MPTYEYKCSACGHAFERFQSITADPVKKCPVCAKNKVKRLISAGAGLIFKGSGFYITDYRDSGYQDKAKADSGGDTGKSSDGKTETKPAAEGGAAATASTGSADTKAEAKPASKAEPAAEKPKAASKSASKSKK